MFTFEARERGYSIIGDTVYRFGLRVGYVIGTSVYFDDPAEAYLDSPLNPPLRPLGPNHDEYGRPIPPVGPDGKFKL
jgi:hypothetical protein